MAEFTNITVYIDNKGYRFDVIIDTKALITTYKVKQDKTAASHISWLPEEFVLTEDGKLQKGDGIKSVEQLQIVRLIWQEIRDTLNIPS